MLTVLLALLGVTTIGFFGSLGINSIINRVKNNGNNNEPNPGPHEPEIEEPEQEEPEIEQDIEPVQEETLDEVEKYRKKLNGLDVDALINAKIDSMIKEGKLTNVSPQKREILHASVKNCWNNIATSYNSRLDRITTSQEAAKLSNNIVEGKWFEGSSCESIISVANQKIDKFFSVASAVDSALKEKNIAIEDKAYRDYAVYIKESLDALKEKISLRYTDKVDMFKNDAKSTLTLIKNEVNNMQRNRHFTSVMADIAKIKVNQNNLNEVVKKLNEVVESHSYDLKMLSYLDLSSVGEKIKELQRADLKIAANTQKQINDLDKNIHEEMDRRIQGLATATSERLAKLKKRLGIEEQILESHSYDLKMLGYLDLASISEKLEKIEEAGNHRTAAVKKQIVELEKNIQEQLITLNKKNVAIEERISSLTAEMEKRFKDIEKQVKFRVAKNDFTAKLNKMKKEIIDSFEGRLSLIDMSRLEKDIETLKEAFEKIKENGQVDVKKELEKIKNEIGKQMSVMITRRLSYRLNKIKQPWTEEIQTRVIDGVKEEIAKISENIEKVNENRQTVSITEGLSDQEFDKIADKVIEKLVISKKK